MFKQQARLVVSPTVFEIGAFITDLTSSGCADDGNYTSSTLFVDVLGALEGATPTNFSESDARSAAKAQSQRINKAARAGYMVRASTDWAVRRLVPYNWKCCSSAVLALIHPVITAVHAALVLEWPGGRSFGGPGGCRNL